MSGQVAEEVKEPLLSSGSVIDNRYQVLTCLDGRRVYLVRDVEVQDKLFAAKISSRDEIFSRTFNLRREYITHSCFDHPNIVKILSPFETNDYFGFLMEYLGGGNLANYIRHMGRFDYEQALGLLRSILSGLTEIHQKNFIHSDLKPENILLTTDGKPKIADFGVSCMMNSVSEVSNEVRGTFQYLCPHYVRTGELTTECDIYAVGLIGYELFSGICPFYNEDPIKMMRMRLESEIPGVDSVVNINNARISEALSRALKCSPSERFSSAKEFLNALPESYNLPNAAVRKILNKKFSHTYPQHVKGEYLKKVA